MMFSLLLRLQMLNGFLPECTGWLRKMGLIVVSIKLFLLVLQQLILIGWDSNVAFYILLHEQKLLCNNLVACHANMSHVT